MKKISYFKLWIKNNELTIIDGKWYSGISKVADNHRELYNVYKSLTK